MGEDGVVNLGDLARLVKCVVLVVVLVQVESHEAITHRLDNVQRMRVLATGLVDFHVLWIDTDQILDRAQGAADVLLDLVVGQPIGDVGRQTVRHGDQMAVCVGVASHTGILHVLEPSRVSEEDHLGLSVLECLEHLHRRI